MTGPDPALRRAILDLLDQRAEGATICPSEAARAVHAERGGEGEGWRDLMTPARDAAAALAAEGMVEVTQQGAAVDPATAKGPIRIRRTP